MLRVLLVGTASSYPLRPLIAVSRDAPSVLYHPRHVHEVPAHERCVSVRKVILWPSLRIILDEDLSFSFARGYSLVRLFGRALVGAYSGKHDALSPFYRFPLSEGNAYPTMMAPIEDRRILEASRAISAL